LIGLEDVDWQDPNVHNLVDDLQMVLDKDQVGTTIVRTQTTRISEKEGKHFELSTISSLFLSISKTIKTRKDKKYSRG
jgi:hypothetical protein